MKSINENQAISDKDRWDRLFWLGYPAVLGLLWIQSQIQHILTELLAYGAILVFVVQVVRKVSKAAPSNSLLSTYARIHVCMGFTAFTVISLIAIIMVGSIGYLLGLGGWLCLFLVTRAFMTYIQSNVTGGSR